MTGKIQKLGVTDPERTSYCRRPKALWMVFPIWICLAFWLLNPNTGQAQEHLHPQSTGFFPDTFLREIYLIPSIDQFLDNYAEGVNLQMDANSSFSKPDDLVFNLEGNSFLWQNQYFRHHRIDNVLSPGTSLYKITGVDYSIEINKNRNKLTYRPSSPESKLRLGIDRGYLGGPLPHSDQIVNFIYGHKSARERAIGPLEFRKSIGFQMDLHGVIAGNITSGNYHQSHILYGTRYHVAHDFRGSTHRFPEKYVKFDFLGNFRFWNTRWHYIFGWLNKDQFGAELGYNVGETSGLRREYLSFFTSRESGSAQWSTGINVVSETLTRDTAGFYRNLIDQGGEVFHPFRIPNQSVALSHHFLAQLNQVLPGNLSVFTEMYNSLVISNPEPENAVVFPLYVQTEETTRQALHVLELRGDAFKGGIFENEWGITFKSGSSSDSFLNVDLSFSYDGLKTREERIDNWNWNIDLNFNLLDKEWMQIKFEAGRRRIPYNASQLYFISDAYQNGFYFDWSDNGDEIFQSHEKGQFIVNSGGKWHSASGDLKQPVIYRLAIPVTWKAGGWQAGINPVYKSFRNMWLVEYEMPLEQVGSFISVKNERLFLPAPGQEHFYKIVNQDESYMQEATGNDSFLFNQPFYASVTGHLTRVTPNWHFYLSFQALMVLGFGPMGNGTLHNNLGLLSESQANPNSYIHYLGRLNSDRSFVGRLFLSYHSNPRFKWALQVKFKDGQAFNYFNHEVISDSQGNDRLLIWDEGIKGDNPFTGEFNSRTDGLWNWEFRVQWKPARQSSWDVKLYFYNLFDLGMETKEFTFLPALPSDRAPLELEIPRGMSIHLSYIFKDSN